MLERWKTGMRGVWYSKNAMIQEINDEEGTRYVVSHHKFWKPGSYASMRSAEYALEFPDEILRALQESVNPGGIITLDMLDEKARELGMAGQKESGE